MEAYFVEALTQNGLRVEATNEHAAIGSSRIRIMQFGSELTAMDQREAHALGEALLRACAAHDSRLAHDPMPRL